MRNPPAPRCYDAPVPEAYRFCPACGGALEPWVLRAAEPTRLVCVRCGFIFYLDPKVAVGAVIANDAGHVLLVKRAIEPGYGQWVFPGGYVDRGEEAQLAAIREAREEAGVEIRIERLLDVYSYPGRTPIIIVYVARFVGGELAVDDEGLEARWFTEREIPWDDLAFRSTHEALAAYFRERA